MPHSVWEKCFRTLENELPKQHFNTWIRPLEVDTNSDNQSELRLIAPNRFVLDWVNSKYFQRIETLVNEFNEGEVQSVGLCVKSAQTASSAFRPRSSGQAREVHRPISSSPHNAISQGHPSHHRSGGASASELFATRAEFNGSSPIDNPNSAVAQSAVEGDWADFDWSEVQGADSNVADESTGVETGSGFQTPQERRKTGDYSHQNDFHTNARNRVDQSVGFSSQRPVSGTPSSNQHSNSPVRSNVQVEGAIKHAGNLNSNFTFKSFVEGKSNQLGLAAAQQVAENPGGAYNPLFIYGGVGLGKTHLMHAVGNAMLQKNPNAKVVYLHSERFVADMVKALQLNAINDFKRFYRSVDALLIDDIQFFAGKELSQEEFFHTFNALLEGGQQIILTCDRYPKEIKGVEERLKSRFGWGLTVAVEPPELETRVAILKKKAIQVSMELPNEAAFFIAQRIRSNVRELEGALKRVIAHAHFTRKPVDVPLVTEALKDLLALQSKQVSIENIQRVVAEYFKIKVSDLHSKRRSRSVARPRQVAMALAKELTNHSLPEIGDAFGGRDHTTVLHACRKIKELQQLDSDMQTDIKNLMRLLTT